MSTMALEPRSALLVRVSQLNSEPRPLVSLLSARARTRRRGSRPGSAIPIGHRANLDSRAREPRCNMPFHRAVPYWWVSYHASNDGVPRQRCCGRPFPPGELRASVAPQTRTGHRGARRPVPRTPSVAKRRGELERLPLIAADAHRRGRLAHLERPRGDGTYDGPLDDDRRRAHELIQWPRVRRLAHPIGGDADDGTRRDLDLSNVPHHAERFAPATRTGAAVEWRRGASARGRGRAATRRMILTGGGRPHSSSARLKLSSTTCTLSSSIL